MASEKLSYKGVGDSRPASSPEPEKGQGGGSPVSAGDFRGLDDSRPHSNPDDNQRVNVGSGEGSKKPDKLTGI